MKLAAISDIHGNLGALEAVLADIGRRGADAIVNLGDVLSGPLLPAETADRLIPMNLPTVRGNHERQLLTTPAEKMGKSDRHAHETMRPQHVAWIAALPATLALTDDVFLCHGTPADDLVYFLQEIDETGSHPAGRETVARRAGGVSASVILCGHSHLPRVVRLDGGRTVVNAGSVGLQAYDWEHPHLHKHENGTPHARYAMIEKTAAGWQAEIVAVEYDWESAARMAEARGRPDWAIPLRTGYVLEQGA
ncbi:MAG TPA: metallophosphoesterase family protein [Rhizomicrobium sp.]|nr:metallophosphoesterase family protein [Rhizomicrobium sp.]